MSSTTTTTPQVWKEGLERLFDSIGGGLPVCWKDDPRPDLADGVILLKVLADLSQGVDEYRVAHDSSLNSSSPPKECQPTSCGSALVTLQVQVETFSQDANDQARTFQRKIRQRLRWPSSREALATIETSLVDILTIPVVDKLEDNRHYSLATMDVRLNTIQVENDKAFGRIDTIEITPTITDDGGNVVPTALFTIDLPDP